MYAVIWFRPGFLILGPADWGIDSSWLWRLSRAMWGVQQHSRLGFTRCQYHAHTPNSQQLFINVYVSSHHQKHTVGQNPLLLKTTGLKEFGSSITIGYFSHYKTLWEECKLMSTYVTKKCDHCWFPWDQFSKTWSVNCIMQACVSGLRGVAIGRGVTVMSKTSEHWKSFANFWSKKITVIRRVRNL